MPNHTGEPRAFTRREFVQAGLVLASGSVFVPAFLQNSALAMPRASATLASFAGVPEDHILVVIQLSGGNDGLNTVVPFGDPQYYRARRTIGINEREVLRLSRAEGVGLHPALEGIASLYDEGLCAIVQGVGYPNPNRSHFKSMDIWHTADTSGTGDGWLGRYFDSECCGYGAGESGTSPGQSTQPPISIGRDAPLALQGRRVKPVAFETPRLFQWEGEQVHEALAKPYHDLMARTTDDHEDTPAAFLTRTALDAQVASEQIRRAVDATPLVAYPRTGLGRQLQMIGGMIRAGLKTRVYYATLGGFDTHAGQGAEQGRHAQLLRELGDASRAFYNDLKAQENQGRVMTMCFSEFGRRVGQNASGGTDHGTAAPLMLMGPMVRPGVFADHPSLTDLDEGDLKFGTDFRSVYAEVLGSWLGGDAKAVLEGTFRPTKVIKV